MLPFLDRDILRPRFRGSSAPGLDQTGFLRQFSRFAVIQDEQIDPRQQRVEIRSASFRSKDPSCQRRQNAGAPFDRARAIASAGAMFASKTKSRLAIRLRQVRAEMFENIERHGTRLARVHVPRVFARPAKRFPVTRCTPSASILRDFQKLEFRCREIVADDADEFDRRKETRTEGGVGCGAPQQIGVFFHWSFDGIKRDGTNNENRH